MSLFILSHSFRFVKRFFYNFFRFFSFRWKSFIILQPLRVCDSLIIVSHRVRFVKHFFRFFSKLFCSPSLRTPSFASSFPSPGRLSALFWVRLFATVLVFYHSGFDLSSGKSTIFYRICKIDALHRLICQSITKITNIFDAYPHLSTLFHVVLHRFLLICLFSAFTFFSYRFFHALYILGRRSAGLVFFDFFRIFY